MTAASLAPSVFGAAASIVDAGVYAFEGDYTNARIWLGAAALGIVTDAGAVKVAALSAVAATKVGAVGAKAFEKAGVETVSHFLSGCH